MGQCLPFPSSVPARAGSAGGVGWIATAAAGRAADGCGGAAGAGRRARGVGTTMTADPGGVTTEPGGSALPLFGLLPTAPCQVDNPAASTRVTPSEASSTSPATAVQTRCGTAATSAR